MSTSAVQRLPIGMQILAVKAFLTAAKIDADTYQQHGIYMPEDSDSEIARSWDKFIRLLGYQSDNFISPYRPLSSRIEELSKETVDRALLGREDVTPRELSKYASEGLVMKYAVDKFNLAAATYLGDRLANANAKPGDLLVAAAKGYLNYCYESGEWCGTDAKTFMEAVEAAPLPDLRGNGDKMVDFELERTFDILRASEEFVSSQKLTFFVTGGALSNGSARALLDGGQFGDIPKRAVDFLVHDLQLTVI